MLLTLKIDSKQGPATITQHLTEWPQVTSQVAAALVNHGAKLMTVTLAQVGTITRADLTGSLRPGWFAQVETKYGCTRHTTLGAALAKLARSQGVRANRKQPGYFDKVPAQPEDSDLRSRMGVTLEHASGCIIRRPVATHADMLNEIGRALLLWGWSAKHERLASVTVHHFGRYYWFDITASGLVLMQWDNKATVYCYTSMRAALATMDSQLG